MTPLDPGSLSQTVFVLIKFWNEHRAVQFQIERSSWQWKYSCSEARCCEFQQ
jgi:hypothetical protein